MLGGIVIIILTAFISSLMIDSLKRKNHFIDAALLRRLFYYHLFLSLVYYLYALYNPSDSWGYYYRVLNGYWGNTWIEHYGTSTTFIAFIGYPFIKFLGFSYEACMALFAFFGFIGFFFFYIFFKEHIRFNHRFFGADLLTIIFFLPNLHFWSSSFGKGSIIFLGFALYFYGLSRIAARWVAIIIGCLIIYHVRPHVMLVVLVSTAIGFNFISKGISLSLRIVFLAAIITAFYFIYADVLTLIGIDEQEFVSQGLDLTHRARELSKATSGVDITNYSLPMQIFTFLYRPLFVDAPGILGWIVSFENVFYVFITLKILNWKGIRFLITSNFLIKTAFFSFLSVTIALAQIAGNLGLAIRQKSQVMMLFLFVILSFLDDQKMQEYRRVMITTLRKSRITPQKVKI